jgi:NAD(P)-dependent dehydrogenase (short-subunit alcohol dehydrogenase family)
MVIVTGASTGIGAATARELASRGFHVLAGVRKEADAETFRESGIEPVILDITEPRHIAALAARVGDEPLHALVNNAGVGGLSAPVVAAGRYGGVVEVAVYVQPQHGQVAMAAAGDRWRCFGDLPAEADQPPPARAGGLESNMIAATSTGTGRRRGMLVIGPKW